jgi:hypothetical protein
MFTVRRPKGANVYLATPATRRARPATRRAGRRSSWLFVVPTGEAAALPWKHDRMEQPAARAAATRHSAGLGARLPVR